jgi:hypothetical protein
MEYESLADLIEPYVDAFDFFELPKDVADRVADVDPHLALGWRLLGSDDKRYGARVTDIFENPSIKESDRYWLLVGLEIWWAELLIARKQSSKAEPVSRITELNEELAVLRLELSTRQQSSKSPVWKHYPGLRGVA